MLIEVKVKVTRIVDDKHKKCIATFILDREFFSNAEFTVTQLLENEMTNGTVLDYEIQSLRCSTIKEIANQYGGGEHNFIVTLRDLFVDDEGNEKYLRYKALLWADNLTQANQRAQDLSHQGYDMLIEGIKQVDYEYLTEEDDEQADE